MTAGQQPGARPGRSAAAVLAGALVVVIPSLGTDMLLRAVGVFPPFGQPMTDALYVLATVYRTIYGLAGSYAAARLAPRRPMAHALLLGAIGLVMSTAGAVAMWDKMPELGPRWYPLALIVLAMPGAWAGGRLWTMQQRGEAGR